MKIFFDILTCLSCAAMLVVLPIEIARFPSKVRQIDLSKNKKNKPVQEYVEHAFLMLELRLVGITLVFFAVAFVGFLFGSIPKDCSLDITTMVPYIVHFCVAIVSTLFLSLYFLRISRNVYRKPKDAFTAISNGRAQRGIGVLIGFYANVVIMFAISAVMCSLGMLSPK